MFYILYNETIVSSVSLKDFGLQKINNPSLLNVINIDFVASTRDQFLKYEDHQTSSNEDYGYYFIEDMGMFEIFSGNKIVVNYFDDIDDDLIHTLLNFPFAILFSQRKKYVLHASSVIFQDKVFCFCGQTQSGKSSIASFLISAGGYLLSEDTCVFDYIGDELSLVPSYNFLKVSDEVGEYTNLKSTNPINFKKKLTDRKGHMLDQKRFSKEPRSVDYFIYLQWSKGPSNLEVLNNETSIEKLFSNEFISYSKENALQRFKAVMILVAQANHYLYSREKKLNTLDNFLEFVNKKLI